MSELKFTNDHECVKVEGDIAWIGITKYAQDALGDLVYVELPELGKQVKKSDTIAVIESVKTAAEVYSPADGEIVEINEPMTEDFDLMSKSLDDGGWIAKIKVADTSQLAALMDEAAYEEFLKTVD